MVVATVRCSAVIRGRARKVGVHVDAAEVEEKEVAHLGKGDGEAMQMQCRGDLGEMRRRCGARMRGEVRDR